MSRSQGQEAEGSILIKICLEDEKRLIAVEGMDAEHEVSAERAQKDGGMRLPKMPGNRSVVIFWRLPSVLLVVKYTS